jgi:hypothetical protein
VGNDKYYRLVDANLNRAREGLRVIEDTARFVLAREAAYKKARGLRHKLDAITREVYPLLLAKRDAERDAGRKIKEGKREDLKAVLAANFRRSQEAIRVLEEYSRLIAPGAGPALKEIRFSVYALEKKLVPKD